jgi:histidinol phosphatase-like enzyme
MSKSPSLVIDFDGVICEHRFPDVGEPTENVRDALRTLKKAGYRIVIHSCRTSLPF